MEHQARFEPCTRFSRLRDCTDVQWTICALLRCQLNFTSLSPAATIFYFRVSLAQTHAISSPRDDPNTTEPIVSTRNFLIAEQGRRPPPENPYPRRDWPALWRGVEAGGKDEGDLDLELRGRLPNDDQGRPSTVAGYVDLLPFDRIN